MISPIDATSVVHRFSGWKSLLRLPTISANPLPTQNIPDFLKKNGLEADTEIINKLIDYFGCQTDALKLAATFLKIHDGQNLAFEKLPVLLNADREDYNIHRLMAAFEREWPGSDEMACLYLLALFNHPVEYDLAQTTLLSIAEQTQHLPNKRLSDLQKTLIALAEANKQEKNSFSLLLKKLRKDGFIAGDSETIAVFQPVHDYFKENFKTQLFSQWRNQQEHLTQHFLHQSVIATEHNDKFQFACKAMLHSLASAQKQLAVDTIYRPHIAPFLDSEVDQNTGHEEAQQLHLYLLQHFFQKPWHKPDFCLSQSTKNYLQAQVGKSLCLLNEHDSATALLDSTLPTLIQEKDWHTAGSVADLLGKCEQGHNLTAAIEFARQSVAYTELSRNNSALPRRLCRLIELYEDNGYLQEAQRLTDKAEHLVTYFNQQEPNIALKRLDTLVHRLKAHEQQVVIDSKPLAIKIRTQIGPECNEESDAITKRPNVALNV